jgi:protein gp37
VAKSKIEWTDEVWNPIAGCSKVSAGCKHCYAERLAPRLVAMGQEKYVGTVDAQGRWTGKINFDRGSLLAPLRWKKPRMVFVNSMSDLFHPAVPFEWVDQVFAVMALCPQHTFQVLTKRPERMAAYMGEYMVGARHLHEAALAIRESVLGPLMVLAATTYSAKDPRFRPLSNVWLGVSVENQEEADRRIPKLLACPAAVRFLSCEPLLGGVDLERLSVSISATSFVMGGCLGDTDGTLFSPRGASGRGIDWVICGGESGGKARPMHPDWARGLRDQCVRAGVPFFFKQWGEWGDFTDSDISPGSEDIIFLASGEIVGAGYRAGRKSQGMVEPDWRERGGAWMCRVGKKAAGRLLDGVEWNGFPVREEDLTTESTKITEKKVEVES